MGLPQHLALSSVSCLSNGQSLKLKGGVYLCQ